MKRTPWGQVVRGRALCSLQTADSTTDPVISTCRVRLGPPGGGAAGVGGGVVLGMGEGVIGERDWGYEVGVYCI